MPHCQKEFSKPPVSSKQKKAAQQAKKESDKAKAAKRAKEEEEAEKEERERARDPAEKEAELARAREAEQKEAEDRRLRDAKKNGGKAFKAGDMVEALACYSECIELAPEDHTHWSNRSAVHKQLGYLEEALADAVKCTELDPEFVKGWARAGVANLELDRFDEAEEAFQRGLLLEPDSTACLDGLKDTQKAREVSREEREFDRLLKELQALEPAQLQARALERGLDEDKVEEALRSGDPKEALVSLITAHKYLVDLITEELQGLELADLRERALQDGLEEDEVAEAAGLDDPEDAMKALLVKHISNDLVDAATELQAEAAETYEDSSDDEAEDAGLDIEALAVEDSDLQLGENDVFIAGAYIDDKYGELVLPNGIRLGNRALSKFYKQRARPTSERQLGLQGARKLTIAEFSARVMRQQERRMMVKKASLSKGASAAVSTQLARSIYKQKEVDNKAMRAVVHHWGAGGGGSHYHSAGTKAYNKGNKVKGVVLRHSVQGAKLQAARMNAQKAKNKSNRKTASTAVLQ
eukprot:TRINITY_DN68504_c0_g1_i1.p1 TRINITY_DN68504_c0_g1~~TRINITY_DN68504_c0_g1_i1.p1  ORF type:complete len:527 (+),score=141.41 TRINITY_DN68504_c0_g1_i1:66-1646(+)